MPTPTIDDAIDALRKLPLDRQEELAGYILQLASEDSALEEIDPAHILAVREGLEQARRGQFASPDRVALAFSRFET